MLSELEITNFRGIDQLHLTDLQRINLIVGKNNTGKTTLLEALRLLVAEGHSTVLNHLLQNHDQFTPSQEESYAAFFYHTPDHTADRCTIKGTFKQPYGKITHVLELRAPQPATGEPRYQLVYADGRPPFDAPASIPTATAHPDANASPDHPRDRCVFLPLLPSVADLQAWWDHITLTPQEDLVTSFLQNVIDSRIEKLDLSSGKARVKLKGLAQPQPLRTLGDGVQKVLALALALVNAPKHRLLLIDEIELGLHYSTLEKLWLEVFRFAQNWEVQIFATTHSLDALTAFYYANAETPMGRVLRLQFDHSGQFQAIPYDQQRLAKVMDLDFEIR